MLLFNMKRNYVFFCCKQMCKRYGGFLRVALADPLPERRWFRRGWVTFRREVNIKDICWNLNNIRVRILHFPTAMLYLHLYVQIKIIESLLVIL